MKPALAVFYALLAAAIVSFATAMSQSPEGWKLEVEKNSRSEVTGVFWTKDSRRVEALSQELLRLVTADATRLRYADGLPHAIVLVPFGSAGSPLGDVALLKAGERAEMPGPSDALLGEAPVDAFPTKTGFFFTHESSRTFTLEHWTLATKKSSVLHQIPTADARGTFRVRLTANAATVTQSGKSIDYLPSGKKGDVATVFTDLGQTQTDLLEGKYGAVDLVKKAKDGQVDPDLTEEDTVRQVVDNLLRKRQQRSTLVWGAAGMETRGVVHLLAKRIAEAKDGDPIYGALKDWRLYQVGWAKLNAEGLVDVATNKAQELCDAVRGRKAIVYFDQVEGVIGLGSDRANRSDVASVLVSAMKAGDVLLLGTTSGDGMASMRSKREFLDQFSEISLATPSGDKLIGKLRSWADAKAPDTKVTFSDEVLRQIVDVTNRYQTDRGQPEKSLAALEALSTQHSPLKRLPPEADRDSVPAVVITRDQVSNWASQATRIATLSNDAAEKLTKFLVSKKFDEAMEKRMVGQKKARDSVRDALLSMARGQKSVDALGAEVGIETLLFLGPSGTGKSFLHEVLSKVLKDENIDLPYEEPIEGSTLVDGDQAVRTLIGASPGFIGYDSTGEGGLLYKMVKRSPQAILVLEEFDKVHEDVDKILYSFLDTGKVQNSSGKTARFTRGLLLLTANYGVEGSGGRTARTRGGAGTGVPDAAGGLCEYIDRWDRHHLFPQGDPLHREDPEMAKWTEERLSLELFNCLKEKRLVNVQVLGRVGRSNVVVFHHFTRKEIQTIEKQQLDRLAKSWAPATAAKVRFTKELEQWLFDLAWGPDGQLTFNVGARGIVDAVKSEAGRALLRFSVEQGDKARGKNWVVDLVDDGGNGKRAVARFDAEDEKK